MKRKILAMLAVPVLAAGLALAAGTPARSVTLTWFTMHNYNYPGSCAAQPDGATAGSGVILWDCAHGQASDSWFQWELVDSHEGWYFLVNRQSGLCAYNPQNGGQLTMQLCSVNYGGELWLTANDGVGDWQFYCNCSAYKDIANNGNVNADGNHIIGWTSWAGYALWDVYAAA